MPVTAKVQTAMAEQIRYTAHSRSLQGFASMKNSIFGSGKRIWFNLVLGLICFVLMLKITFAGLLNDNFHRFDRTSWTHWLCAYYF